MLAILGGFVTGRPALGHASRLSAERHEGVSLNSGQPNVIAPTGRARWPFHTQPAVGGGGAVGCSTAAIATALLSCSVGGLLEDRSLKAPLSAPTPDRHVCVARPRQAKGRPEVDCSASCVEVTREVGAAGPVRSDRRVRAQPAPCGGRCYVERSRQVPTVEEGPPRVRWRRTNGVA